MKLVIYSVIQKKPPINEALILWDINEEGEIISFKEVEAYIAIPEDEEELSLIPNDVVKDMIWDTGYNMHYDDFWSYSVVSKGE